MDTVTVRYGGSEVRHEDVYQASRISGTNDILVWLDDGQKFTYEEAEIVKVQ